MSKLKHFVVGLSVMAIILFVALVPAEAASGSVSRVLNYVTGSHSFNRDVTGDGKADKVVVNANMNSDHRVKSVQVSVNGTNALTITRNSECYYGVTVNYIKMSKTKVFLQILGYGDNDCRAVNSIYRYDNKTGRFNSVLSLSSGLYSADRVVSATSTSITVQHYYQPVETGGVNWKYTYVFKNGKYKLKSSVATVKSSLNLYDNGDGYFKYFKNSKFKAAKSLTFYTGTSQKKKAFTVKKGAVLQLKKIKVSGKKIYMQFQYGSKTGWKKVENSYTKVYKYNRVTGKTIGWFYGVYERLAG